MAHDLFTWDIDERYRDPNPHQFRRVTDADLAALGYVRVTEDCETCEGGTEYCKCEHHIPGDTSNGCLGPQAKRPCPDCGGTGKQPRDGAFRRSSVYQHMLGPRDFLDEIDVPKSGDYVVFPAEWLEAE